MKSAAEFNSLQELLSDVIYHNPAANVKILAAELEVSVSLIYQKASPNSDKVFNLRELEAIVRVYRDARILDCLGWSMNYVSVPEPETGGEAADSDMAGGLVVKETGLLMIEVAKARRSEGPGGRQFTRTELTHLVNKTYDTQKAAVSYRLRLLREPLVEEDL